MRKHSPRCTKKIIKYSLDCLQTAGFFFLQWSLVQLSVHHGHFPHVGTSLRTRTRITPNTYPITYVITLISNRFSLSLNTPCFATLSMNAIIKVYHSRHLFWRNILTIEWVRDSFVCLPLLTQFRHNSHLLYLLPYHFYHQSINIILWLDMLYQKKNPNDLTNIKTMKKVC